MMTGSYARKRQSKKILLPAMGAMFVVLAFFAAFGFFVSSLLRVVQFKRKKSSSSSVVTMQDKPSLDGCAPLLAVLLDHVKVVSKGRYIIEDIGVGQNRSHTNLNIRCGRKTLLSVVIIPNLEKFSFCSDSSGLVVGLRKERSGTLDSDLKEVIGENYKNLEYLGDAGQGNAVWSYYRLRDVADIDALFV